MENTKYVFKPKKFYLITLVFTWVLWFAAAFFSRQQSEEMYGIAMVLMFLGLIVPSVLALVFVKKANCSRLKQDYKEKLCGFSESILRICCWQA